MTSSSVWFPDAFEGVPEAAIERLTRTDKPHDRHGACCLWSWLGDRPTACPRCRLPGALLVGHAGQYVLHTHAVHATPDGDTEHQALWSPHACDGGET